MTILAVTMLAALLTGPAGAAIYYVDIGHRSAADYNAGTQQAPWKTVQHAVSRVQAGDVVIVRPGEYDEVVTVKTSGAGDAPIVLRAEPSREARVRAFTLQGDHITIQGFEVTPGDRNGNGIFAGEAHRETARTGSRILDNHVHNLSGTAIFTGENAVVRGNLIRNVFRGAWVNGGTLFENNEIDTLVPELTEQNGETVAAKTMYTFFAGDDITFRGNYFHGAPEEWLIKGMGVCFFASWDAWIIGSSNNILIEKNRCFNATHASEPMAVEHKKSVGITYRNNLFVNTVYVGIMPKAWQEVTVENNTLINCGAYPVWLQGPQAETAVVRNNLISYIDRDRVVNQFGWKESESGIRVDYHEGDKSFCDYNLMHGCRNRGYGPNDAQGEPQFMDPENGDFRLKADSPGVDAGVTIEEIKTDLRGVKRPQGEAYDIGAYESSGQSAATARLIIHDEVANRVDTRLFGQFFERASFGDWGPEAVVDPQTGRLPERILEMLQAMEIPVVRFPGGTDIDYIDWREMIDNVPGREGPRPKTAGFGGGQITNRFGYDEYFAVRDQMGWQTILVVNLLDGLAKKRPLAEAAQLAAGLVAYVNAAPGTKLPEGMPDWPAVRAKNGRVEPFGIQYVQIGNEMYLKRVRDAVQAASGLEGEALARWYVEVLTAYIRAIRAVDPEIPIIVDHWILPGQWRTILSDPYIRRNVRYLAQHKYTPGPSNQISRDEVPVDTSSWSQAQWWWVWATMPGEYDEAGQNISFGSSLASLDELGYRLAATEWNWNGWNWRDLGAGLEAPAAAGIGVAGWLHGMMRRGDRIDLATQSMLLGVSWPFAAVFADREGAGEPYFSPQGAATNFYRKHHGDRRLRSTLQGVKILPQPYRVGWGQPLERVALLDVLVTACDGAVFIHAINRDFDRDLPLEIDFSALGFLAATGVHHTFTCKLQAEPGHGVSRGMVQLDQWPIAVHPKKTLLLPRRTASIIVVERN